MEFVASNKERYHENDDESEERKKEGTAGKRDPKWLSFRSVSVMDKVEESIERAMYQYLKHRKGTSRR